MIELIIKKFLDTHLDVPSFLERPKQTPNSFVLFEKIGSSKKNHLKAATVVFQSYALSMYAAARLNEKVKEVVENMIQIDEISKISLNSDYNFTDTETKEYRYQAVFHINYY